MRLWAVLLVCAAAAAQTPAIPSDTDARALYERALQLMESTALAVPDLARAGIPLRENARNTLELLKTTPGQPPALHHRFQMNLRAFLLLSDAVPRPAGVPAEMKRQMEELRGIQTQLEVYYENLLDQIHRQLYSPDRDNLQRYADENARTGPPQPTKARVVFMGDSITDRWRLNEYFSDRDYINRGISGQITSQMLARFRNDVIGLKPNIVVILAGTNDIARSVTLPTIESNLASMADLADHYRIRPVFCSVLPVSDYHRTDNPLYERTTLRQPDVIRALNTWMQQFCIDRGYTYINYWPALADEMGMLKKELAADGLHPDGPGYRLMAPILLSGIERTPRPAQPGRSGRRP